MIKTRLYQCFHDHGSIPDSKYISDIRVPLLCGASVNERNTQDIQNVLRDNEGSYSISYDNKQFSELTGCYWVCYAEDTDIVGIEHYRRHFIKHDAQIDNCVHSEDLITENEIISLLQKNDFIVPVHESLWNTSVYDLYVICFGEFTNEIVKWMKEFFKDKPNYINSIYENLSHNKLYRGNMLITTRLEYKKYCKVLFDMLFFMKRNMRVKPDSRVWGYVAELFPMIYIIANNKSFVEVDVAVDDEDFETKTKCVRTTQENTEGEFDEKIPDKQIEFFKTL